MSSRQIGFRLDPGNPREAQALAVLKKGQEAGYSTRHVLTEALLALEMAAVDEEQASAAVVAKMSEKLDQLQAALEGLKRLPTAPAQPQNSVPDQAELVEVFVQSVKSAAKPGVSFDPAE